MWLNYLDKNPEIVKINQNCVQLGLDEKVKEDLDKYYKENLGEIIEIREKIYKEIQWKDQEKYKIMIISKTPFRISNQARHYNILY